MDTGANAAAIAGSSRAEERELVAAILRKDRKATAEFVARYADGVYRYVRSRLIPRVDLIDDLVQEVFLAAWESLPGYRGDSPLSYWLQGIARHKVENFYRTCLRAPLPLDENSERHSEVLVEIGLDESLDRERLLEKTRSILTSLPDAYRLVLRWRYWDKRSAQEMAAETGKTEKAIERLLARAREMFRERWKHE